jgi:hypothetical protein
MVPCRPDPEYLAGKKFLKYYENDLLPLAHQFNPGLFEVDPDDIPRIHRREYSESFWTAPLDLMIARYFPGYQGGGSKFECPKPLTPEFWKIYSEPLDSFALYALMFTAAITDPIVDTAETDADPMNPGLANFLGPIGISLESDERGNVIETWLCPSLLASFARMALQDQSSGGRVLRCECCGMPFVSNAYQAHYCSTKCGDRHRKRRARANPQKAKVH